MYTTSDWNESEGEREGKERERERERKREGKRRRERERGREREREGERERGRERARERRERGREAERKRERKGRKEYIEKLRLEHLHVHHQSHTHLRYPSIHLQEVTDVFVEVRHSPLHRLLGARFPGEVGLPGKCREVVARETEDQPVM